MQATQAKYPKPPEALDLSETADFYCRSTRSILNWFGDADKTSQESRSPKKLYGFQPTPSRYLFFWKEIVDFSGLVPALHLWHKWCRAHPLQAAALLEKEDELLERAKASTPSSTDQAEQKQSA